MVQFESHDTIRICFWKNDKLTPIRFRLAFRKMPTFRFAVAIAALSSSVCVLPVSTTRKQVKTMEMDRADFPEFKKLYHPESRTWMCVDDDYQKWEGHIPPRFGGLSVPDDVTQDTRWW
jgi:hypothetical protein